MGIVSTVPIRAEVNGRPATSDDLRHLALVDYGHFTAMQVREGRTRGLDLHMRRLEQATRELFDSDLDRDQVRAHIRHALAGTLDASVRVIVVCPDPADAPAIMVTVRPPAERPGAPQALKSVPYQRPVPHLKHIGGFGQTYYRRQADRHGFDDALLTGPDGVIAEGAITNFAGYYGTSLVWPDAPCLAGITMQLLQPRLEGIGVPSRLGPVLLRDVPSFSAAFVTNSRGIAPVARIDDTTLPVDHDLHRAITDLYDSVPWDPI